MGSIVVTGATGGFGQSLVENLAGRGLSVVAVLRPGGKAKSPELARLAGVTPIEIDQLSRESWREALAELDAKGLTPDGAVLSAGGWKGGERLHESKDDELWQSVMASNLETAHVALAALLPGMVQRKSGSVVLLGSRAAERPQEAAGASAYAVAKAAVVALAKVTAQEVLAEGVRVNVVLPSTIDTPQNRAAMPKADPSRWVSAQALSDAIAFLLSEASQGITGSAVPVYGRVGV